MKKIFALVLALILVFAVASPALANVGWFDFNYDFQYVIINFGSRTIEGVCEKWWDYEDSDAVQVQIDGVIYLTHYENVLLCSKKLW